MNCQFNRTLYLGACFIELANNKPTMIDNHVSIPITYQRACNLCCVLSTHQQSSGIQLDYLEALLRSRAVVILDSVNGKRRERTRNNILAE